MNCQVNMSGNKLPKTLAGEASRSHDPAPASAGVTLRKRLAVWRQLHPMPESTGKIAEKAFFEELSGDP